LPVADQFLRASVRHAAADVTEARNDRASEHLHHGSQILAVTPRNSQCISVKGCGFTALFTSGGWSPRG